MQHSRVLRSGVSIQTISLIFLVLQNSTLITVMHRSRMLPSSGPTQRRYLVSTAMLIVELIKLVVSLEVACFVQLRDAKEARTHTGSTTQSHNAFKFIWSSVYDLIFSSGSWMLIPTAGLYALQTRLVYIAVSNMDTVPFQVTYQLKILTTVLFSIAMVQRVITPRQWLALLLLTLGVAIVQVADATPSSTPPSFSLVGFSGWLMQMDGQSKTKVGSSGPTSTSHVPLVETAKLGMNTSIGFLAAIAAAFISGFTGVYFEKLIKESRVSVSLWTRNAQLSFYSLFPIAIFGVWWKDGAVIAEHGFFAGYCPIVWATIMLQALGGILVAICITYADNVVKNLAASFSIVVSYLANSLIFGEPMSLNSTIGISTVLLSLYLYQRSNTRPSEALVLPVNEDNRSRRPKEVHEK